RIFPMFENLSDKLQRAFKNLRGQGTLTEENMNEALREIRMALLEADVNFKVVKELIDHIREKAMGQEVMTSLSPAEQVVKIVRDEMVAILGTDTAKVKFASQPPSVILMAGLQGSGKTTTSGKLAQWLKKGGHRPMLVSVDVYRPAAREQLKVVAKSMTGQDAVNSAQDFHKRLGLTGVVLTKMDGDARGGAALSIRHVTGQPIKFIGTGEKPDAFEPFHPDRITGRILGMGDMMSLLEKAEGVLDRKKGEEFAKKALMGDGFS